MERQRPLEFEDLYNDDKMSGERKSGVVNCQQSTTKLKKVGAVRLLI
jgi:hypothetical protein